MFLPIFLGWQHLRYFVVLTIFLTGHPGAANLCFLVPLCFVVSFVALFGNEMAAPHSTLVIFVELDPEEANINELEKN